MDPELEKLTQRIMEAALHPHLEGPHTDRNQPYYHYTTAEGFHQIMKDSDLWVTNIQYLNDPLEAEYGFRVCKEFLVEEAEQRRDSHFGTFLDGCWKTICSPDAELFPYDLQFIACFSLNGDLLSQWRAYADMGRGFCLGFSHDGLLACVSQIAQSTDETKTPRPFPLRVLYSPDEQRKNLADIVAVAEEAWPFFESRFLNDETMNKELKDVAALWMAIASMCFKDKAFAEEKEVRLVYSNVHAMKAANTRLDVRLRTRNGLLIPYRFLGLASCATILPLAEVVMGPALDAARTRLALEMYLRTRGYDDETMPRIVESCVPLRH